MTLESLVLTLVKSLILMFALLTGFAYLTLFERKVVGRIQVRLGPNRVGPFGLLQPLADGVQLLLTEYIVTAGADKIVFFLAPLISVVVALMGFAVIPVGPTVSLFGQTVPLYLTDLNIGVVYLLAVGSLGVYGIVLAGWSSNNKYALLGGVRSAAQVIRYQPALGLSLMGVVIILGSLSLVDIVNAQERYPFILVQPLGFLLYLIAAIAETNRAPFDLPEAETELVAGYHTEYSGLKFAMFYMAEYINMITVGAVASTVFLGGWRGPFNLLNGPHWLILKIAVFMFLYVWLRASLPRIRYDRLMRLGWLVLLPLGLLNVLLTAIGVLILG